jgi:hypothetical protein
MNYIFNINQLDILNQLIFDGSIRVSDIKNLNLNHSDFDIEIDRRAFENIKWRKKIFWTFTYLNGIKSIIRFENIKNINVLNPKNDFQKNDFIIELTLNNTSQLIITTVGGIIITIDTNDKTKIYLKNLEKNRFGNGIVFGKSGYTQYEWKKFLKEKKYIQKQ